MKNKTLTILKIGAIGLALATLASCKESGSITESTSLAPSAPTAFTNGTIAGTSIAFSWTYSGTDDTGTDVEMCTGASCTSFAAVSSSPLAAADRNHTQTGLTVSTVYRFRVRITNAFGSSDWLTSSDITTTAGGSSVTANTCTSPTTKIVDYGQRATAGTTLAVRGSYSEIAINPVSGYPGVVYTESHTVGATALKYMFWDGDEYKIETVVGGVATVTPKLVYLSTGIPLIFWVNAVATPNGAVYGAARSTASVSAAATWTVAALDVVAGNNLNRGLDASVNPDDEVFVAWSMASNIASGMKSIICTSSCATMNTTNYPAATVMDATNTSTNTYSMGTAWCNSGAQYYPVAFYGSSANFRLATCRQANAANCSGNWSAGIIGAANANRLATDVYVDPTATDGTVYMIGLGAAGIIPFTMTSCATQAAAATWGGTTTGTAFGAATTGNAWVSMGRDSSSNFHVAANEAQTNIRYFNSPGATFATVAWNAAPATNYPETVGAAGLPAAGAGKGGLVVDQAGDQVLIAYGRLAAVTPISTWGNVVIAYNDCPNGVGAPACSATTLGSDADSTGMWWGNMAADTSGQIQKTSLAFPNVSIAETTTGTPAVAYVDYSVSGTTDPVVGGRLKFAYRNGTTATSQWIISVIGSQSAPQSPSLAFDENDKPWIAWNETPAAAVSQRFFLATNTNTDGSGAWTVYSFPMYYAVGAITAQPAHAQAALAMYEVSGVKKPLVITMSVISAAAQREVRAALFDPATRQWSNVKQVATFVGAATIGGSSLTADADTSGNVVIAFNDLSTGAGQVNCTGLARCVRFAYTTDGGATWTATSTSGIVNGAKEAPRIKLNPTNSRPALAFFDRASNLMLYKYCTTALASCTSSSNWADVGIGIVDASIGISGLAEATNMYVLDNSLTFASDGSPWVVYPRGAGATTNVNLAFNYVGSGGTFGTPGALYTNPGNGYISTPVVATANNFALSWNPSSVRSTSTGSLHTAFIGPGNFLYVSSCGN